MYEKKDIFIKKKNSATAKCTRATAKKILIEKCKENLFQLHAFQRDFWSARWNTPLHGIHNGLL